MPSQLGFFGPESFYDSSQINMYLGDDSRPPIGVGPVQPKPPQGTSPIFNMGPDSFRPINMGPDSFPQRPPSRETQWQPTRPIARYEEGTYDDGRPLAEMTGLSFAEVIERYGVNNPLVEREAALRGIRFEAPPSGTQARPTPNEAQLQREYQEYRNSIGNPPTIANDYFYWRADRLAEASGTQVLREGQIIQFDDVGDDVPFGLQGDAFQQSSREQATIRGPAGGADSSVIGYQRNPDGSYARDSRGNTIPIERYQRNPDGSIRRDPQGRSIPTNDPYQRNADGSIKRDAGGRPMRRDPNQQDPNQQFCPVTW